MVLSISLILMNEFLTENSSKSNVKRIEAKQNRAGFISITTPSQKWNEY